jgi:D-amino-acid dehydrogenase
MGTPLNHPDPDVIVIGAGIIATGIAVALQAAGKRVVMVERKTPGAEASGKNAGAFAFADIVPLATPGILRSAPKWLLDPLGPLSIPPSYLFSIAPWLLKFWRASRPDRFPKLMKAQADLMALSRAALERQVRSVEAEHLLQRDGQLRVYQGRARFDASKPYWNFLREQGVAFDLLKTADEIAEIQPGLNPEFSHAGYTPDWINTRDPAEWLNHLIGVFVARGGKVEQLNVVRLEADPDPVNDGVAVIGEARRLVGAQVVVAAGAWSHRLAQTVGDKIPLETERGYNTTLPQGDFRLKTHLTFAGHGFVASRINDGVRVGGAVELGGLSAPPNFKRAQVLLDKAGKFMTGLNTDQGSEWMGFRPSMPDSIPVIDRSPKIDKVVYAFGHGHLGLTQAAGTAELVRALILGHDPPIKTDAFSVRRF